MKLRTQFFKISLLDNIDKNIVDNLYAISVKSFIVSLLLSTLVTISLYPFLKNKIVLWYTVLFFLHIWRLYNTYLYRKEPSTFSVATWYKRFLYSALASAFIYASLGFFYIHQVDFFYQLFILTILLGLSSGSSFALFQDMKLSITYMLILLLPLIITLLFLTNMPLNFILSATLLMHLLTQITTINTVYSQKITIENLICEQTLLHNLFKKASLGIFTYNNNLEIIECNEQLSNLFGHTVQTIKGMNLNNLPDTRGLSMFKETLNGVSQSYRGPYISLNGSSFWLEAKTFPFSNINDDVLGGVAIVEDKTKEHTVRKELEYMVEHDVLTGLLNRRGFTQYINNLVKKIEHETHYSILFYLDLDQFKAINDSLGHEIGDKVLLSVSKRLIKGLKKKGTVSRLGGDEFIIVIPFISKNSSVVKTDAKIYVEEIKNVFTEPYIINNMHLHMKASIGIVIIQPSYTNTIEIIRHADLSMYQAKNTNNHISYYDESLDKKQKEVFLLQQELAYAADKNQLELFLQPIVKMKNDKLLSAELLIRWNHPTRGLLSPKEFIPLAIKAGLLSKITWWIIDKVCEQIAQWKTNKQWKLAYISININAKQLIENNFANDFLAKLKINNIKTSEVVLEITERSLIDNFISTQGVITQLRDNGLKCAIDDFGIGYSSLSYLKKLSFDILKIDREFVKDLGQKPQEIALIKTILDIGHQFNYNIVIEGVDKEEQKKLLLEIDKDVQYQGYYFSKPLHVDAFTKKFLS